MYRERERERGRERKIMEQPQKAKATPFGVSTGPCVYRSYGRR